ncbi:MAG: threonine/serine exporter family protein [Eubacteriales bacterium]|nr:threonine/serine exporter family protein [Eubacteriales bacterium]
MAQSSSLALSGDALLQIAADVGENILKNGGEISRVEDTVGRICYALGAVDVQVFCITNCLQVGIRMPDGTTAQLLRRMTDGTELHLYRLQRLNQISRQICSGALSPQQAKEAIEDAKHALPYPDFLGYIGAALFAAAFAIFFGGTVRDGVCAALVALLMLFLNRHRLSCFNRMAYTVLNAFVAGACSVLLVWFGLGENLDKVLIGTIMVLIPGLAFGNALRDMLGGNLLSGAMRILECLLLSAMIAFGYAAALTLLGGLLQ